MKNNKFVLTTEIIEKANDYMSIREKYRLALIGAHMTIIKQDAKAEYINSKGEDIFIPMPPVYEESSYFKEVFIANVLLTKYLKVLEIVKDENENELEFTLTDEQYDQYMSNHLLQSLYDAKKQPKYGAKIKALLNDLKRFTAMLDTEIKNLLARRNNPTDRIMTMQQAQTTPESIKSMQDILDSMFQDIDNRNTEKTKR